MTEEISYPVINKEICKGCMRCIVGCPQNAILLSQDMNNAGYQFAYYSGNGCTGCKDCYFTCPEPLALEVASGPIVTPNSEAISYFIFSIACLAPGTTN